MGNTEILDEFQPGEGSKNDLKIDDEMQVSLSNAAQWGNILAIIGFVMVGFGALVGLVAIISFVSLNVSLGWKECQS